MRPAKLTSHTAFGSLMKPQEQGYQRRIDRIRKAFVKGEDRS